MHALCTLSPILAREQTENARAHEGGGQSAERSPTNGVDSQSSARSPAPDGDRQSAARSPRSSARSPTPVFPSSESPPTESPPTAAPAPPAVHMQNISALLSPGTVALQHVASCSLPQQQTALATPKSAEEDDTRKPASGRGSRICPHCGVYARIDVHVCACVCVRQFVFTCVCCVSCVRFRRKPVSGTGVRRRGASRRSCRTPSDRVYWR